MISGKFLCRLFATGAEVLFRHSFGRRYAGMLLASLAWCAVYTLLAYSAVPPDRLPLLGAFLAAFFCLVLYRLGAMFLSGASQIHSLSTGASWSLWGRLRVKPIVVRAVLEPALCLAAGMLVFHEDIALSTWLCTAGCCLGFKVAAAWWKSTNRVMDTVDARLDGQGLNAAVQQQTAPRPYGSQGASMVVAALPNARPTVPPAQHVNTLDPALRRLLANRQQALPPASGALNRPATPPPPASNPTAPPPRRYHAGPLGTLPRITSPQLKRTR